MSRFSRILIPGIVYQSVIMAGGYGTGREIVEYFLQLGPYSGLLAMLTAALLWGGVCALTFEYCRRFACFDYQSLFRRLLRAHWWIFEVSYLGVVIIVTSIIISSANAMVHDAVGGPSMLGGLALVAYVAFMVSRGSSHIEKAMSLWTGVLYAVYIAFFATAFWSYGGAIQERFQLGAYQDGWWLSGFRYGAYNLGLIPAVLFTVRHLKSEGEAIASGFLAGLMTIVPGMMFFVALTGQYPAVLEVDVPATFLLKAMGAPWLTVAFHVALFGTLIETGVGLVHALCERALRVSAGASVAGPRRLVRTAVALVVLGVAFTLAQFGLVALIARGYEALTWVILVSFILPISTIGVRDLVVSRRRQAAAGEALREARWLGRGGSRPAAR